MRCKVGTRVAHRWGRRGTSSPDPALGGGRSLPPPPAARLRRGTQEEIDQRSDGCRPLIRLVPHPQLHATRVSPGVPCGPRERISPPQSRASVRGECPGFPERSEATQRRESVTTRSAAGPWYLSRAAPVSRQPSPRRARGSTGVRAYFRCPSSSCTSRPVVPARLTPGGGSSSLPGGVERAA